MPSSIQTDGTPTNDPDAAIHWAAEAIRLKERREKQGHSLTDEQRRNFDRFQDAARSHGFTDAQVRDYAATLTR